MKHTSRTIKPTSEKSLLGILIALIIVAGSTLVFFNLYGPYVNTKSFSIFFGVGLALLAWLTLYPVQKVKSMFRTPLFWAVIAYALSLIISTFTSIDPTLSLYGLPVRGFGVLFVLVLTIFSLIIGNTLTIDQVKRYVFFPISISGVLIALSVDAEKWGWKFLASASDGGLLGNTSYVGTYIIAAFFVTTYLLLTSKNKKWLYGLFAFVMVCNRIFINFSFSSKKGLFDIVGDARGAALALIIGAVVGVSIWLTTDTAVIRKRIGQGLLSVFAIVSLIGLVSLANPNGALHTWLVSKASNTRFIYWNIALKGFQDKPILGNGPSSYIYTYQTHFNSDMYLQKNDREVWADNPHNVYLETLSSEGIVGIVGYLTLLIVFGYTLYIGYKRTQDRYYIATMSGFFIGYLINNFLIFDTVTSYLILFALIGSSIAYVQKQDLGQLHFKTTTQRGIQIIIAIAVLVALSLIVIPQIVKMERQKTDITVTFNEKIALYPKTERGSPYGSAIGLSERLGQMYEDQITPSLNSIVNETPKNKEVTINVIDSGVNTLQDLFTVYQKNTQGLVNIGKLESVKMAVLNRTDEQSLETMKKAAQDAIVLAPQNPAGYWLLAQAYVYEQKYDEAFAEFEKARAINPQISESHKNMIRLATFLEDQKKIDYYTQRATTESEDYRNNF